MATYYLGDGTEYTIDGADSYFTYFHSVNGRMVAFTKSDTGVTTWMGADIVNSTSNTRDENGVTAEQRYTPFGEVRIDGNLATDHTYTGQVNDETTGLAFYNARYYDPATARFITPDSIVPNPNDGQDYNRYTYVRNNPVRFGDPSGNVPCEYCNDAQQERFDSETLDNRARPTHSGIGSSANRESTSPFADYGFDPVFPDRQARIPGQGDASQFVTNSAAGILDGFNPLLDEPFTEGLLVEESSTEYQFFNLFADIAIAPVEIVFPTVGAVNVVSGGVSAAISCAEEMDIDCGLEIGGTVADGVLWFGGRQIATTAKQAAKNALNTGGRDVAGDIATIRRAEAVANGYSGTLGVIADVISTQGAEPWSYDR